MMLPVPLAAIDKQEDRPKRADRESDRPAKWAKPLEREGLPNLHRVSDGLYRGAQPTDAGFAELAKMGVKTVVNLRSFHSDRIRCRRHDLRYERIRCQAWDADDDEVVEFLRIATDPKRQPVFVHCQHGADRTGMMTAVYRVAVEGWTKEEAIREMTEGGFGYHTFWRGLIEYVRELDVAAIRREAGLDE